MPRKDGNTPGPSGSRGRNNNHKPMHSASHGKGMDRRLKLAKQHSGQDTAPPKRKRQKREDYEPA